MFISEKISSEGYAASFQMSEDTGPALGLGCSVITHSPRIWTCPIRAALALEVQELQWNQGLAQQNPLYWAIGLVCS